MYLPPHENEEKLFVLSKYRFLSLILGCNLWQVWWGGTRWQERWPTIHLATSDRKRGPQNPARRGQKCKVLSNSYGTNHLKSHIIHISLYTHKKSEMPWIAHKKHEPCREVFSFCFVPFWVWGPLCRFPTAWTRETKVLAWSARPRVTSLSFFQIWGSVSPPRQRPHHLGPSHTGLAHTPGPAGGLLLWSAPSTIASSPANPVLSTWLFCP